MPNLIARDETNGGDVLVTATSTLLHTTPKYAYSVIGAGAGHTHVKNTPGVFHGYVITTAGAADSTIQIRDALTDTTGTVVATFTGGAVSSVVLLDVQCGTGIVIVMTAGSGVAPAITALYI